MAIKSKDEILSVVKGLYQDDTSDDALSFIEDISDTFGDLETRATGMADWKQKYEENDKQWREKYRNRFFNPPDEPEPDPEPEPRKIKTFNDLFTVKEK